ncbi:uncharacterized protein [Chelonus insularis]|uniref:uncharacterized protein n=1 Tax=Chelonus insularis TaxID=460826 RepID=UPI00158D6FDB|nr:uncharacterized protein LOC118073463 [Chelonus insularis]
MLKLVAIIALAFGAVAIAAPTQEATEPKSFLEDAFDIYASCSAEPDLSVCLKLKALRFVDRAARSADISIVDGLKIVQTEEAKRSRADNARSLNDIEATLPAESEAREAAVDEALVDRAGKFLSTHTVEISLPEEVSRSLDEARGKKKKVMKFLGPILLLLKLKAAIIVPIILGALALLAFKALVIGKIALIISAILAFQKLWANKGAQSYEVVAHPVGHHDEHHGWARSASGSELAYSAYKPAN